MCLARTFVADVMSFLWHNLKQNLRQTCKTRNAISIDVHLRIQKTAFGIGEVGRPECHLGMVPWHCRCTMTKLHAIFPPRHTIMFLSIHIPQTTLACGGSYFVGREVESSVGVRAWWTLGLGLGLRAEG